ncbi:MAG: N-acetyltransferase DgcN [Rhodospirillales bacterium]
MDELRRPYLLFLGDAPDRLAAKTAIGVLTWRPDWCLGQVPLPGCQAVLDLPPMSPTEAAAQGAGTLVIGVANAGGVIGESWLGVLEEALAAGLDVASGLHQRLDGIPRLRAAAADGGTRLVEVRIPSRGFPVGTGEPRPGKRLLTVGTDCSVGKMYTTLALERDMQARGMAATFRATGQTGILIAGGGVAVDAVVADFISGAIEWLAPANAPDHWDLIEGQGSLFHPSYAGVSLGLLHGAQPDALVLCHEPTRTQMRGLPKRGLPDLGRCVAANEDAARLTNPAARCVGVAVDTSRLQRSAGRALLAEIGDRLGLPCVDPMIEGTGPILDRLFQ